MKDSLFDRLKGRYIVRSNTISAVAGAISGSTIDYLVSGNVAQSLTVGVVSAAGAVAFNHLLDVDHRANQYALARANVEYYR